MGRKCSTHFNGVSCDSGRPGSTFQGSIFTFPSTKTEKGKNECTKWLQLCRYKQCYSMDGHL